MSKSLIITEKPSVAGDIAKALGGFKKGKDYYESEKYLISWAVGHLFELAVPASMKAQDKWDMKKLPIMPPEFELAPAEKMGSRVNVLRKLIKDKNVADIINACDAGREGELIFRYIIQYAGTKKPIMRLWLQSMTTEAIREDLLDCAATLKCDRWPARRGVGTRRTGSSASMRRARLLCGSAGARKHSNFPWPGADADAHDHRRPREKNSGVQAARIA